MGMGNLIATLVSALVFIGVMAVIITIAYMAFRKEVRGRKNYERALKMVQVARIKMWAVGIFVT